MRRALLVGVLLALLLGVAAPAAATPTHEETTFAVEIQETGDAVWTVSTSYTLESDADRAAFDQLRSEFEAGTGPGPSVDTFRSAADQVAAQTDRDMEITAVDRSSSVTESENVTGTLTLTFTWTNFAVVTEKQVSVESAFAGGWFGDLAADQTLTIEPPSGYRVQTATPSTDIVDGALCWNGPQQFEAGEPGVVFETVTVPGIGLDPMVALGLLAAVVGGGLLLLGWRNDYLGGLGIGTAAPEESDETTPPTDEPPAAGAGEQSESDTAAVDTDLLSDEERVERLLRENDGRMKQARIVEETRWSNAKVSQLLSAMEAAGRVEKLRIGRENLISLPEESEE
ncbi:DUF7345 domain-containing protein [Halodesulfurarchaeum formicicum]|uniref:HTH iclR-type domain-containing protein n=1 Tax=Halodesulfurarchaeum formicicum TaxID=1873524 RepID=A0A1J1ADU5_9EURY|nr:hypothetical protein [Halodesulfurarchaeum formicicum]APE96316.1 hypothetical protein HSR6_1883 [Halodesulfurarchaeum formicicum]